VLDSVKSFPDVQRRSDVDNRADQFLVRASALGQPGDTIPLRLEVTFTDAGRTTTTPLPFEVVLGEDIIGVDEENADKGRFAAHSAMVTRRVFLLPATEAETGMRPALLDASGRKVMVLSPGANVIGRLPTGVYFITCGDERGSSTFRRLVVVR
jgi:hypothetical protein